MAQAYFDNFWVGLLALGALLIPLGGALDRLLDANAKRPWVRRLILVARGVPTTDRPPSALFDKIFGPRIFSYRSVVASIALTLLFVALWALVLAITQFETFRQVYGTVFTQRGATPYVVLIVVTVFVLASDFVSYAQSRVFLRAIEQNGSGTVTSVMLLADFVASLVLFAAGFALAHVVCIALLFSSKEEIAWTSTYVYSPTVVSSLAGRYGFDSTKVDEVSAEERWRTPYREMVLSALTFDPKDADRTAVQIANAQRMQDLGENAEEISFVSYTGRPECYLSASTRVVDLSEVGSLQNTTDILRFGLPPNSNEGVFDPPRPSHRITSSDGITVEYYDPLAVEDAEARGGSDYYYNGYTYPMYSALSYDVRRELERQLIEGPPECPILNIAVDQRIDGLGMLRSVSFSDMYLMALFWTLNDTLKMIPDKFGSYQMVDFWQRMPSFLGDVWTSKAAQPFGIGRPQFGYYGVANSVRNSAFVGETGTATVPFTTFLTSSLAASLLVWLALGWRLLVRSARRVRMFAAGLMTSGKKLRSMTFTFLAVTFTLAVGGAWLSWTLLNGVWGLVAAVI